MSLPLFELPDQKERGKGRMNEKEEKSEREQSKGNEDKRKERMKGIVPKSKEEWEQGGRMNFATENRLPYFLISSSSLLTYSSPTARQLLCSAHSCAHNTCQQHHRGFSFSMCPVCLQCGIIVSSPCWAQFPGFGKKYFGSMEFLKDNGSHPPLVSIFIPATYQ